MLNPDDSGLFDASHGVLRMNNQDITKYSDVELLFDFLLRDKGTEQSSVGESRVSLKQIKFPLSVILGGQGKGAPDFREEKSFIFGF